MQFFFLNLNRIMANVAPVFQSYYGHAMTNDSCMLMPSVAALCSKVHHVEGEIIIVILQVIPSGKRLCNHLIVGKSHSILNGHAQVRKLLVIPGWVPPLWLVTCSKNRPTAAEICDMFPVCLPSRMRTSLKTWLNRQDLPGSAG